MRKLIIDDVQTDVTNMSKLEIYEMAKLSPYWKVHWKFFGNFVHWKGILYQNHLRLCLHALDSCLMYVLIAGKPNVLWYFQPGTYSYDIGFSTTVPLVVLSEKSLVVLTENFFKFSGIKWVQQKCEKCTKGQDWKHGNNYNVLWKNKTYYS